MKTLSKPTRIKADRIVMDAKQAAIDFLRLEMGRDPDWQQVQETITDSFKIILDNHNPVEGMKYTRQLTMYYAASKFEGKPCWERLRQRLLCVFSEHRGAIFHLSQLLGDQS